MAVTYLDGIDISNHQPHWTPGSEKYVYVLCSDGHSWKSPTHDDQIKLARAHKKRVGHYHWLRPGNIQAQVDWFWRCANPKDGDALIVDWEQAGTSNADKDQFIKALQAKIPKTKILKRRKNRVVLYCNRNYWLNYDKTSVVGDELWIAEYGVSKPGIRFNWRFWQYADGPGTDHNHAKFASLAEYDAWALPKDTAPAPDPSPVPVVETIIPVNPTLGAIHTKFGQWGKWWSWNRGKNKAHPNWGQHGGDDWHRGAGMAEVGDPIVAVAPGTIIYAGDARKDGGMGWGADFGIHVLNKWDTGGRTSIDAHMVRLAKGIKAGVHVKVGQVIGYKGMTGNVNGPHDHHEQHLGTKWPDKRVKPIYPGKKVSAAAPSGPQPSIDSQEDLDVAEQLKTKHRTGHQVVKPTKDGKRSLLYLDDRSNVSWAFGKGRYAAVFFIRFTGADASDELLLSVTITDTDPKNGNKTVRTSSTVAAGLPGGDGTSFREYYFRQHIGAPAKGLTRRLRLSAQNYSGKDITVTEIYTYAWKAPL